MVGNSSFERCMLGVRSIVEMIVLLKMYHDGPDAYRALVSKIYRTQITRAFLSAWVIRPQLKMRLLTRMLNWKTKLSPDGLSDGWADSNKNIYVRDGIVVVVKNAVVEDGTKIGKN